MFKNTFQSGFLSILYSIGSKPLQIWDKKVRPANPPKVPFLLTATRFRYAMATSSESQTGRSRALS